MPISFALLFCIPIGFAFYYEARWLVWWANGRSGMEERRAMLAFTVFGGLLIPGVYSSSLAWARFRETLKSGSRLR